MSKRNNNDGRFERAVLVSRQHPEDFSLLDAIVHYFRANPYEIRENVADT